MCTNKKTTASILISNIFFYLMESKYQNSSYRGTHAAMSENSSVNSHLSNRQWMIKGIKE